MKLHKCLCIESLHLENSFIVQEAPLEVLVDSVAPFGIEENLESHVVNQVLVYLAKVSSLPEVNQKFERLFALDAGLLDPEKYDVWDLSIELGAQSETGLYVVVRVVQSWMAQQEVLNEVERPNPLSLALEVLDQRLESQRTLVSPVELLVVQRSKLFYVTKVVLMHSGLEIPDQVVQTLDIHEALLEEKPHNEIDLRLFCGSIEERQDVQLEFQQKQPLFSAFRSAESLLQLL